MTTKEGATSFLENSFSPAPPVLGCPRALCVGVAGFVIGFPRHLRWRGLRVPRRSLGENWDIISGILALIAAPFCRRSIVWPWIANGVGLVLLANVARAAILSSPVSFGWPVVPKLELIYHVPYALIIPVCIDGALIGHIALTRALLRCMRRGLCNFGWDHGGLNSRLPRESSE